MKIDLAKKEAAIKLRRKGKSIRNIEKTLNINRSTLSGWLRNIELTNEQKTQLHQKWLTALIRARLKAAEINRNAKIERIRKIKQGVGELMSRIEINKTWGELIFSIFYLAEGTKKENAIVIANSNPEVLKSFLTLFRYLYKPNELKFRCCLHLRKDQSNEQSKNYWSETLKISESQFYKTQFDKRTIKSTYKNYKGVCVLTYLDMNLQRRILYIGEELLQTINKV
ncbi:MAG: hypothetical protein Q7S82_01955 [bacterium]|nr:hypothetical protein [bacterium]